VPRRPLTADCSRMSKTLVKARAHRRRDPGTRDAARECDGRYALAQRVMAGGVAATALRTRRLASQIAAQMLAAPRTSARCGTHGREH
jgi:hypothetical protein